jgi:PGF-CTERM protein
MYKVKMGNSHKIANIIAIALVLSAVIIAVTPVSAAAVSVTRDLPDAVYQGEEFNASLTQSGFLLGAGKVTETLPEGFEYVLGSLPSAKSEYDRETNNLTIDFEGETIITYVVKAGTAEQIGTAVFSGTWRTVDSQLNKIDGDVTGDTTLTLGSEPTPTPGNGNGGTGGNGGGTTTPTPTPTPTATATVTPGGTPTPGPTATPSGIPTTSPGETPTSTPSVTGSPAPTSSPEAGIPGFEVGFAIAGLLTVAYLVLRRKRTAQP